MCESCRRGLADLGETLAYVADHQEVEAPEGFERVMWARVERQLQDTAPRGWRAWFAPRRLALAAGAASLVLAAFVAGRWTTSPAPTPAAGSRRGRHGATAARSGCCSAPPANTSIDRSGCWWSC